MITRTSRAAALCVLLASTFLASALVAQTSPSNPDPGSGGGSSSPRGNISPPAEKYAISPGGVDMRSGQYPAKFTDLSIGGEGDSGLSLSRSMSGGVVGHVRPFGNFSHDWDVLLTEKRISVFQNRYHHDSGEDYEIRVHFGGRSEVFRGEKLSTGFSQTSRSAFSKLTYTGDKAGPNAVYTYEASDGTVAVFSALATGGCSSVLRCAYVSQITQPDGTALAFGYENAPLGATNSMRLRTVTSTRGYALALEYGAENLVSKACVLNLANTPLPAGGSCPADAAATSTYIYTNNLGGAKLASATDASGAASTYTYSGSASEFSMGFVKPGQRAPWMSLGVAENANTDGDLEQVIGSQSFADGSSYSYAFERTPPIERDPNTGAVEVPSIAGGSFTDAMGNVTTLKYDFPIVPGSTCTEIRCPPPNIGEVLYQVTPGPVEIIDPLGRVTKSDYCDPRAMAGYPQYERHRCLVSVLQSFTDPEGIKTELTYDAFRNVSRYRRIAKPGSGLADIITSSTFNCLSPKSCAKPASVTDAKGNVTDYTYSPAHGGVLTETAPAVNGVRAQKRYSYAQRYAWVRNASGALVQAAAPIWVLTQESLCKTGAASGGGCVSAGDEVVTTYDYGPDDIPNNLLLRGIVKDAGGLRLRTCYAYDALGNKTSETSPRAGLTSCQ